MIKTKWGSRVKLLTVLFGCFVLLSLVGETDQGKTATLTGGGCSSMGNPAYAYCTQIMGYDYRITTDANGGQDGVCIMPDGVECPQWDFYAGKCGQEQSYCVQHGMQLEIRNDGKDPYSLEYGVCVDQQGDDLGTIWTLSGVSMIADELNDLFIEDMQEFEADPGASPQNRAVPTSFDWRNYAGADWMTPVKNQSTCGSCWAFSAVGLAEAQHKIMANDPNLKVNLAEQYLVSTCFTDPWGDGDCSGGREPYALQFIHESGVPDEDCYPYKAQNSSCSARCSDYACRLEFLPNAYWSFDYSEQDIKFILSSYGPVTLGIGFDPDGAGAYWDGDIRRCTNDIPSGGTNYLDHAVLAVGYNDAGGYWIVKNSWGSDWNGDGYFKLGYNECNVAHSRISWVESGLPGSNEAPTNIGLSKSSVVEGQPINTVVGTFSTADPNPGDTHTYTLVSGTGSTDNAVFNISGDQLRTSQVFNKAIKDTYAIRVRSADQGGLYFENTFTINVTEAGAGMQIYLPLIISGGGSSPIKPLLNGNFESGPDGSWTEYSSRGWDLILHSSYFEYVTPHGGQWAVWLGGDDDETARISQPVTISASQPYLHFWVWFDSEDVCGYDNFYIIINGTELAKYYLCYEHNTYGWVPIVWDLSAYSGQTVTLTFEVTTDVSLISNLFLDDVSLSSSNTADASEENQLTNPFGRSLPIQKKRE